MNTLIYKGLDVPASMVISYFVFADVSVSKLTKLIIIIIQGNTRMIQSIRQSIFSVFLKTKSLMVTSSEAFLKNKCIFF